MSGQRRTTTERGLGWEHQKRRKAMVAAALGTLCPLRVSPRCTVVMDDPRLMDLDHSVPRAVGGTHGDRVVCSSCNRSAGASFGNRLRSGPADLASPSVRRSRVW